MKILVTGGTGVVGSAAIPALLQAGHDVRLLSRGAERDAADYPHGVEAFAADIGDPDSLTGAADGCEVILHIAGIGSERLPDVTFDAVNIGGTRHVLAEARRAGLPRFIFLSSLGAERGASPYHASKRRAEELVRDYAGPWLILRPGNVYGPGDETVSLLLRMVRTLPALPLVEDGNQPFQPLWYRDLGGALAAAAARPELDRQTLELAGPEITTTTDLLDRLCDLTGRNPPRIEVPVWLTRLGASALESFGGLGGRLLESSGVPAPISSTKLQLLLEGSVLSDPTRNALLDPLAVAPTPLQDGLEMLTDLLPETLPGEGVGAMERTTYAAIIHGSPCSPEELMERVTHHIREVMPLEFAAEPGASTDTAPGATLTASIPGRGNIQVRVEERTPTRLVLSTLQGHPLAGELVLECQRTSADRPASTTGGTTSVSTLAQSDAHPPGTDSPPRNSDALRFAIEMVTQPSNLVDWFALRTVGGWMQAANWREVVRRVVTLSEGQAPEGVRRDSSVLEPKEAKRVAENARERVQGRRRAACEDELTSASATVRSKGGRAP